MSDARFDRDAARDVLWGYDLSNDAGKPMSRQELLDALAGCVRPIPPQVIDRDALTGYLKAAYFRVDKMDVKIHVDWIVAFVVPDLRFDTIRALHSFATYSEDGPSSEGYCGTCDVMWPCATIRALDNTENGENNV